MPQALFHDGSTIEIEVHGAGPTLLLPVNPQPVTGPLAEQMRQYGADPALGQSLITGLSDAFRVVAFDYEGQCLRRPKPDTLTPANTANDLLAVADAAGADRHASYNVAKKVVGFEFEERIPRTRLCSAYGDGFKGAPLRCTPQSQDALPRDSNIGDENSISQQPQATGGPHYV